MKEILTSVIEDELATLWARMSAAMARFFVLVGELEERGAWADHGCTSIEHWLGWRCGIEPRTAREYVRVAKVVKALPRTMAALDAGEVSYSKVRAITRVATPENEDELLGFARNATAPQLERIVARWKRSAAAAKEESERLEGRRFASVFFDDDGMLVVRARLAPDEGAIFMRAMDAARAELWKDRPGDVPAEQQRADQLALVADRSLSETATARAGGDRVMVFVHLDAERPDGSAEPDRRLACDASVVEAHHHEDGQITTGRKTRVLSSALRRALRLRDDETCTFPACTHRVVDAHHVKHWMNGGATVLGNLTSLCRTHHTLVHEGGFTVTMTAAGPRFFRPDGRPVPNAPPMRVAGGSLSGSVGPWSLAPIVTTPRIDWDALSDHLPS